MKVKKVKSAFMARQAAPDEGIEGKAPMPVEKEDRPKDVAVAEGEKITKMDAPAPDVPDGIGEKPLAEDLPGDIETPAPGNAPLQEYFKAYPDNEFYRTTDGQVFHGGAKGRSLANHHQRTLNGENGKGKVEIIKRK